MFETAVMELEGMSCRFLMQCWFLLRQLVEDDKNDKSDAWTEAHRSDPLEGITIGARS